MNSELKINDEEILLIELCRLKFNDEHLIRIRDFISIISDWNYFGSLVKAHGVGALVWHNLDKHHLQDGIPEEVLASLRGALMISLSRNAFNTEIMGDVLKLLNAENIKTVLLKGLALENTVYGNSGLRQMSDVDVLIDRKDCIRARDILLSNGFDSLPVKSVLHKLIISNTGKHLPSVTKNGAYIDIHNDLFGVKNNALTRMLYANSYVIELIGEQTYIPQPQIFFLYLVRHLNSHEMNNESQLRLYTDLVVMIEKYPDEILNYDLIKYASEAGMSEILASHLGPLRDLWGISFSEWTNDFINRWYNQDSLNKFLFFLSSPKDNPPSDKAMVYRHTIGEIPGVARKFIFILGDIFPSVSFMKKRYGCNSFWKVLMYYPHRLGKIIWLLRR